MNIVTIFLGVSVGATASAENFLQPQTLAIIALGLVAFSISTVGGLLTAKIMCIVTRGKINPLIGSAEFRRCLWRRAFRRLRDRKQIPRTSS